ncbi:hypothetical protein TNCV_3095211, partial [Trichonephila clavipes]
MDLQLTLDLAAVTGKEFLVKQSTNVLQRLAIMPIVHSCLSLMASNRKKGRLL